MEKLESLAVRARSLPSDSDSTHFGHVMRSNRQVGPAGYPKSASAVRADRKVDDACLVLINECNYRQSLPPCDGYGQEVRTYPLSVVN
jgi:hypothetical protein